ncbi:MAG: hypothetical protein LVQ95_02875 [Candidatus Micrarchaeales archaeon]|nr:hypothetical protein [Candidatus Micrarchaeales archaeon]
MKTEYEAMVKEFLPALRARAAKLMSGKYKMNQIAIAEELGTTQAAVSKYLSNSYSPKVKAMEKELNKEDVELFVKSVREGEKYEAQRSVCKMCAKNLSHDCSLMIK